MYMKTICKLVYYFFDFLKRLRKFALLPLFGSHGKNFSFDPDGTYSFESIYVGDDVLLGLRPVLLSG